MLQVLYKSDFVSEQLWNDIVSVYIDKLDKEFKVEDCEVMEVEVLDVLKQSC